MAVLWLNGAKKPPGADATADPMRAGLIMFDSSCSDILRSYGISQSKGLNSFYMSSAMGLSLNLEQLCKSASNFESIPQKENRMVVVTGMKPVAFLTENVIPDTAQFPSPDQSKLDFANEVSLAFVIILTPTPH